MRRSQKFARVLRRRFKPSRLGPGVYAARSEDDAYGPLRALGLTECARVVGERERPGGHKTIVVQVFRKSSRPGPFLRSNGADEGAEERMDLDPEYFQTVKRDYSDWRDKWWREVVQNSVDAGATEIRLSAKRNADGTWTCVCEDNGGGMSLETLRTKFLRFGGTTKRGEGGAAGGFGKAKELIVLPWLRWSVHSRDHVALGVANRYRIESAATLRGTRVEAVMSTDAHTSDAEAKSFLAKCYLPRIKLFVNDVPFKASLGTREEIFAIGDPSDPKAKVYFNKNTDFSASYYFVRVKGPRGSLYMFDGYIADGVQGNVIIELLKPSIDILTANRDSFADWSVRAEFERFVSQIAADVKSAFRAKKGLLRKKYEGSGNFAAVPQAEAAVVSSLGPLHALRRPRSSEEPAYELDEASTRQAVEIIEHYGQQLAARAAEEDAATRAPLNMIDPSTAKELLGLTFRGQQQFENAVSQLVWTPDFYVLNEVENFRVPKKFLPEAMSPRILHLAKCWTELVRFVLIQLGSPRRFGVGWIFSDGAAAAFNADGGNWVLLNPFIDGAMSKGVYVPSNKQHRRRLYALAIHECTHFANDVHYHDESFATALTYNIERCADGWPRLNRLLDTVTMRGGIEADE